MRWFFSTLRLAHPCRPFPVLSLAFIGLLILLWAAPAGAQPTTGAVFGTVTTSTDIGLPGVTVTMRNATTGFERVVATQTNGSYVIPDVPVQKNYEIQAQLVGFASVVHSNVEVLPDARMMVDFFLYAATSEALVVTGRIATLERERSTVQQVVGESLAHTLPLVGRDFLALTSLTAGFTGNPNAPSPQGQIYWSNNVLVDGASHFSKWRGAARTFYSGYGLETISGVQVLGSQFSSEFGEALATVTVAVTNSGTNTPHGSALVFAQHGALNDIPAFTPSKPPFTSARYGATFSGPIVKDLAHFFGSFEGRLQRSSNIVVSPVSYGARAANDEDEQLLFFKVDYKISHRDMFTARYNGQWFDWHNEPGGISLAGTGINYTNDVQTLFLSDTALISGSMLNQMRFQFARYNDVRRDLNPSVYVLRAGYSVEGGTLGPYGFGANPEDTWEGADTLSYRKGDHSIKVGGGMKHASAHTQALPYGRGAYLFSGPASLFPTPFMFIQAFGTEAQATADPHSLAAFGFAQDNWSLRPTVTLDVGLRYDIEHISNVRHYDAPTDKNNLQPRVGVAWQPELGKTLYRGGLGLYMQQQLLGYINRVQLEGADGTATILVPSGSPFMPTIPNVLPASVVTQVPRDVVVLDPSFRNPYSVQLTIGAERRMFGLNFGADVVYLRGHDLMSIVDINAPTTNPELSTRSVAEADATRPTVPTPNGFRKVISLGNEGQSWYRALQLKANRSTGPILVVASYTLARAVDQANYELPEDSRNLDREKARADNDIRHNLSIGLSWQLPGGHRGLNGVTLSGVGLFRSNRPYTISWGDDRNGTTQFDARPDERNTGKGGTFNTVDLSLAKRFRAMGKTVEARLEAFNVVSTTNYDEFVGTLNSPLFGQPTTAFPRRRIQFAAIVRF